jgi:hypothetical protein
MSVIDLDDRILICMCIYALAALLAHVKSNDNLNLCSQQPFNSGIFSSAPSLFQHY